jgi:RNA polymerase sigma-70 factor (ECF subfamily)
MGNVDGHTALLEHWLERSSQDGPDSAQARERLLEHAGGRLERLTRKMLGRYPRLRRWEDTGDVLQNALLRLHRALGAVRPGSIREFFALAATQIRRELIDLSRHHFGPEGQARHHHTDPGGNAVPSAAEGRQDPHGEPATLLEWAEFHEQVGRLPEAERETFELLWYQGLTQKEAAGLLGVTERTVKNRWRSAKLLLAGALGRAEG